MERDTALHTKRRRRRRRPWLRIHDESTSSHAAEVYVSSVASKWDGRRGKWRGLRLFAHEATGALAPVCERNTQTHTDTGAACAAAGRNAVRRCVCVCVDNAEEARQRRGGAPRESFTAV